MAVFGNISAFSSVLGATLGAPGDTYIVTDLRKRSRKEPNEVKSLKSFDWKIDKKAPKNEPEPKAQESAPESHFVTPELVAYHISNNDFKKAIDELIYANQHPGLSKIDINKYKALLYSKLFTYAKQHDAESIRQIIDYVKQSRLFTPNHYIFKILDNEKILKEQQKTESAPDTLGQFSLGRTASDEIYNNNDLIQCKGMKPTYQILPSYDYFFEEPEAGSTFAGFGLRDTKKLIRDYCRKYWRDCAKIAQHLKGDTLLQSCFNLWHWMRTNIRYEYDREGREEVRSPRRVWADRKHGVDCDCLSVFAWCVLKCMGYNPAFELVAFRNKPDFSHIFINCDGVIVDRVWFIFNALPPGVTKSEIYKVDLLEENLGKIL